MSIHYRYRLYQGTVCTTISIYCSMSTLASVTINNDITFLYHKSASQFIGEVHCNGTLLIISHTCVLISGYLPCLYTTVAQLSWVIAVRCVSTASVIHTQKQMQVILVYPCVSHRVYSNQIALHVHVAFVLILNITITTLICC